MNNAYDEIRSIMSKAREVQRAAEYHANGLADLLLVEGALRNLASYRLERLKKELANYNMRTRRWKK